MNASAELVARSAFRLAALDREAELAGREPTQHEIYRIAEETNAEALVVALRVQAAMLDEHAAALEVWAVCNLAPR